MKVFISWSGEMSRKLGELLRTWLPGTLQHVKPYFTPEDVEKGARWNSEIAKHLAESSVGILCLTPDNLQSSWLMFEAGALSKQIERSRICPILFGIDNTDLKGPLVQFQTTIFCRDDMLKFIQTVNSCSEENQLEKDVLASVFDTWWPKLESNVNKIINEYKKKKDGHELQNALTIRSDRELIEEVLELVRLVSTNIRTSHERPRGAYMQPSKDKVERIVERIIERPRRRRLSDSRQSVTHQFSVSGHEGIITVGLYDDGSIGELFITLSKEGSTVGGIMNAFASAITIGMQYGIPLVVFVDMFRHFRFEPSGMTSNRDIPFAKSIIDYIFAWIGCMFIPGFSERNVPLQIRKRDKNETGDSEDGKDSKRKNDSNLKGKTKDAEGPIKQKEKTEKNKS